MLTSEACARRDQRGRPGRQAGLD